MRLVENKYYRTKGGRKIGPAECWDRPEGTHRWALGGADWLYRDDGGLSGYASPDDEIVAEWTEESTGPVRTITRKEIVPGVYGRLRVHAENYAGQHEGNGIGIGFTMRDDTTVTTVAALNADELRAAAATLNEIADALSEVQP